MATIIDQFHCMPFPNCQAPLLSAHTVRVVLGYSWQSLFATFQLQLFGNLHRAKQANKQTNNSNNAVVWQLSSVKTNKQTNNNSNNAVVWQPSSGKTNSDNNRWILRQLTWLPNFFKSILYSKTLNTSLTVQRLWYRYIKVTGNKRKQTIK